MKKYILAASATLVVVVPAVALAGSNKPTTQHIKQYEKAYTAVAHKLGKRAPGRNIAKWGLRNRAATDSDVVRSTGVLDRMLTPPASYTLVVPSVSTTTHYTPAPTSAPAASTPVSSGGAGGVPACASESGTNYSTGPANTNPSSGATGRYQIIPSTAAGYGCNLSTPAGQDACAQVIYAHQGASAWVGCGG